MARALVFCGCLLILACAARTPSTRASDCIYVTTNPVVGNPEGDTLALEGLVGTWVLELWRDGTEQSVVGVLHLTAFRRNRERGALHLNHSWYDVAQGPFELDLTSLLADVPRVPVVRLLQRQDSVGAMIGATMSVLHDGDLALMGFWEGESIRGEWHQIMSPGCPSGRFELRRPAT